MQPDHLALILATAGGSFFGFITGAMLIGRSCNYSDDQAEKRGVWTIKDRAYKLVPLLKDPR